MFKINYVSSEIYVYGNRKKYGFRFDFNNGLNIITGQNSSGKSSILSCIYYNLGMEQLLGMGTSKSSLLDKCLTSEFTYKKETYTVTQSMINLEIENNDGKKALLERMAVSPNTDDKNRITIYVDGNVKKRYLHAINDHSDKRGFYTWLQSFLGIELPKENGSSKHTLYLQNLFSSCFVEQTKGWSDFMSQMPSFNIKDARRKLVEYLLSLDCLENDIEKDRLKNEKATLLESWNHSIRDFERIDHSLLYKADGLSRKYEKARLDYFDKLKLKVNIDSEWVEISSALKSAKKDLDKIRKENRKKEKRKDLSELNENRKKLKLRLLNLNRVKSSLDRAYTTEQVKTENYNVHLTRLKEERSSIVGASKVDELLIELADSESCPLCDSSIELTTLGGEVSKSDYESSIKFIDSKISMISNYLESFSNYINEYQNKSKYYESLIYETRSELSNIDRDLNANIDKDLYRSQIQAELVKANLIEKLNNLVSEFDLFKSSLGKLNKDIIDIDANIKGLSDSSGGDGEKIRLFEEKLRQYLKEFHYTSNAISRVNIKNKQPYKAFPSVFNASAKSDQSIRLASSASDFIRAEWSFYLALLEQSKVHPGVLIFDEPGQHAMSLDSMKKLLSVTEKIDDKQVILAISKFSKGYNEDKVEHDITIKNLTLELNNYKEIEIDDDGEKLISELKKL
ncbi:Rad50/SbcC-type AAA domain-containing protein [Vibrio crassostreae]|nr:AAA_23 domain-containing protein [Vibrio chagasii]CAK1805089.1 Rad50/SbcC-type AAA domain-containing protein [Vibrio crassostreae]CAK1814699.1 Rad50/SbcC-type AAA domain-containing protein [Vibrio crassostreae]CAK2678536.1 Rad50/SbcC-type AAA domain-containing protein [Vibrio crassostreae]CAK2683469.1 Rad50/SbcC-type AAA domain-containing protein [Vibrio crassostreae]